MNSQDIGTTRTDNIFAQASLSLEVFVIVLEVMEKYWTRYECKPCLLTSLDTNTELRI